MNDQQRAAMQMALPEYPERVSIADIEYAQCAKPETWSEEHFKCWQDLQVASRNIAILRKHITALREALAQESLTAEAAVSDYDREFWGDGQDHIRDATGMMQEPVASAEEYLRGKYGAYRSHGEWRALEEAFNAGKAATPTAPNLSCKSVQKRLATSWGYVLPEQQEPVAWVESLDNTHPRFVTSLKYCSVHDVENGLHLKYIPLYTTPPTAAQAARQMRDAAVKVCHDLERKRWETLANGGGIKGWSPKDVTDAIAALPIPGEEK